MRIQENKAKRLIYTLIAIVFWISIWSFFAWKIDNKIFLPSPASTLSALKAMLCGKEFYDTLYITILGILKGFALGVMAGFVLGILAYYSELFRVILAPLIHILKAVPVASFIILSLLFVRSDKLSVLISFTVTFPIIYINVLKSMRDVDVNLLRMSKVFDITFIAKIRYVYVPGVLVALLSGCEIGIGFAFKSGIAAEIIGQTTKSVGYQIYLSKLYLETDRLFAWTIVIIIVSIIISRVFGKIFGIARKHIYNTNEFYAGRSKTDKCVEVAQNGEMCLEVSEIGKSYKTENVFKNVSFKLRKGDVLAVMGPSGAGKTTLLRIIEEIEKPDSGKVIKTNINRIGVVFQENTLFDYSDVFTNIYYATLRKDGFFITSDSILKSIEEVWLKGYEKTRADKLSGGMKRRVALLRAMIIKPDLLILDEPFTGLDSELKDMIIGYVNRERKDRITVVVTHDREEAEKMGAKIYELN